MNRKQKMMGICLVWAVGLCLFSLLFTEPIAAQQGQPVMVSPPNGCTAMGPGSGIIQLQWQPVEGAFAYEVRVHQASGENRDFVRLERQTRSSFGTSQEGEYQWQVRALYGDPDVVCPTGGQQLAYGPWGEQRTFQVKKEIANQWQGSQKPDVVFPRQGGALVDGNNYRFHWTPVEGAYQYQVCLDTPNGVTECHMVRSASYEFRSALWSGPRYGAPPTTGAYRLRVRAIGENGVGEFCEPVLYQFNYGGDHGACWHSGVSVTQAPVLLAPTDGSTLNPTPDGFLATLQWEPVPDAAYYEIKFRVHDQGQGQNQDKLGQGQHGFGVPPTSVLTEEPLYDLVVPNATPGVQYVWKVRAIIKEAVNLVPTVFSEEWRFTVGTPEEPMVAGEALLPDSFDAGVEFSGPGAVVHVDWKGSGDGLCQVSVCDATGTRIIQTYRRGAGWDVEPPDNGGYHIYVRKMDMDRDGKVASMTPPGEGRMIEVTSNAAVDGGRQLGDLVNDGAVDSGDAIRVLRYTTGQDQTRLTLRDASCGDCNGDCLIDSGDAIYMLRKAVGSNR